MTGVQTCALPICLHVPPAGGAAAAGEARCAGPTVDSQIITLKASGADVFVNVATPKFAAQALRKMAELGWKPAANIVNNVSNSVGGVLRVAGLAASADVLSTFYFKDSTDPTWSDDAAMKEWRASQKMSSGTCSLYGPYGSQLSRSLVPAK